MCPPSLPFRRANPVNTLSALRSITNASREKRINTSLVALKKNGKLATQIWDWISSEKNPVSVITRSKMKSSEAEVYGDLYNPDTQSSANHTQNKIYLSTHGRVYGGDAPQRSKNAQTNHDNNNNRIAVTQSIVRTIAR